MTRFKFLFAGLLGLGAKMHFEIFCFGVAVGWITLRVFIWLASKSPAKKP